MSAGLSRRQCAATLATYSYYAFNKFACNAHVSCMFCKGEFASARLFLDAAGVLPPLSTLCYRSRKLCLKSHSWCQCGTVLHSCEHAISSVGCVESLITHRAEFCVPRATQNCTICSVCKHLQDLTVSAICSFVQLCKLVE